MELQGQIRSEPEQDKIYFLFFRPFSHKFLNMIESIIYGSAFMRSAGLARGTSRGCSNLIGWVLCGYLV